MEFEIEGKVDPRFISKASEIFKKYREGLIHPKKTYGKKYRVLEVSRAYRLLCVNGDWSLMSHSKYNRIVDMGK